MLISCRIDYFDLLAVQESSPTPQLESINSSALSLLYGPTLTSIHEYWKKTIALTIWTFVGKLMSLLFNMLSRFVSSPSKQQVSFTSIAAITICSDFGAQENKICHCFHFSPFDLHEVMGQDAMILVFQIWVLSQLFDSPLLPLSGDFLVHLCFLPIELALSQLFCSLLSPSSTGSLVLPHFLH